MSLDMAVVLLVGCFMADLYLIMLAGDAVYGLLHDDAAVGYGGGL